MALGVEHVSIFSPGRYRGAMRFTVGIALNPLDQLTELARTAEECGFSSIAR
jgi:hypothetical protein